MNVKESRMSFMKRVVSVQTINYNKTQMKEIQKKVSEDKTLLYFKYGAQSATIPVFSWIVALIFLFNCQRWDSISYPVSIGKL